ncbi:hypothetical protein OA958_05505, partial [Bacteroidota bacterium]|nr:hypothetical protein [Bacteroidota bacterium]
FNRTVKIQFGSGAINFDNLVVNGSQIDLSSGGSCPGTSTQTVTITPDEDATFAYGSSSYCASATDPTPTVSGVSGGTFSSTTGLIINSSTGAIDLDSSTAGAYVVTYSTASTEQTISSSNLFTTGPNATWTHVYTSTALSDGAASQNAQTLEMNITSLPSGGANLRVVKSTANGNGFNGPSQALQLGTNTFTVGSVSFDRYVKFQFSSGAINFDNLVVNGNTIDLNPGTCPGTATDTVTITPSEDATFSYDTTNYCSVSNDPTPTIIGTTGGVFSATPTGLIISASTGAIDLDASTAGTYNVQYITSTSTCADTATASIIVETCTDTDGDGIPDITDLDDDNDGIPDTVEGTGDTDGDGIIDKFDLDSDNDGIADIVESGGTDANGDGLVDNFTDTDNDGLHDPYDADNGGTTVVPSDTDSDGVADYLDLDADNDGIYDVVEGGDGASDTNGDGVVDNNDTGYADANSNGMADNTESTTEPDSDTDGIADYLELDSDGDGCNDVAEAGYTDANGDGILGVALPTFNTNGTVDTTGTSSGGYNTPADIDGNTVADYTEAGPNNASAETLTACDSLVWNGTTYTTSGTYTYTTTNMSGCDSVVTLTLTINNATAVDTTATACDSLVWYGNTYTSTGSYTHTLQNSAGCDSVITLNLTINNSFKPATPIVFNFQNSKQNWVGTKNANLTAQPEALAHKAFATTSFIASELDGLNVNASDYDRLEVTLKNPVTAGSGGTRLYIYPPGSNGQHGSQTCYYTFNVGQGMTDYATYTIDLNSATSAGTYGGTIGRIGFRAPWGVANGDTIFWKQVRLYNSTAPAAQVQVACDSYVWQGNTYTSTGIYNDTLQTNSGCDSIVILDLTINSSYNPDNSIVYNFQNSKQNWVGTKNANLSVQPEAMAQRAFATTSFIASELDGLNVNASDYNRLEVTLKNPVTAGTGGTRLYIHPPGSNGQHGSQTCYYTFSVGQGMTDYATYTIDLNSTTSAGTYAGTIGRIGFRAPWGVANNDTIFWKQVRLYNSNVPADNQVACDSFVWHGNTYTSSGTYNDTLQTIDGCDSIVILNLTIVNPVIYNVDTSVCFGDSLLLAGTYQTVSGTYNDTIVGGAANTCDSIVVTSLTVSPQIIGDTSAIACDSLHWYGSWYNTTGAYSHTLSAANGCDSIVTLNLTITPSETATFSYDTTNYCSVGSDPTPTITGTSGGVFSAVPSGLSLDATSGLVDLSTSNDGTYTVQYVSSTNTCADTSTVSLI